MEWCKQLIAATISSQISGSVPSEGVSRDYRVSDLKNAVICFKIQEWKMGNVLAILISQW